MGMRIRIFDTPHDAGIHVASLAERVILQNQRPVLGLATGSTPIQFYHALINLHKSGLDLADVVTINLDEYASLSPHDAQSYHFYMNKYFFEHVNVAPENIHIPNGIASDLAKECLRYDAIVQRNPIDFQVVGIGMNGHIGFNEPNDLLLSRTHVVALKNETIESNARFFDDISRVPQYAITMGVQSILQAKQIVLMAFGMDKSCIVQETVLGGVRTDVPASVLQLHHDVTVVLDKESASGLMDKRGNLSTQQTS